LSYAPRFEQSILDVSSSNRRARLRLGNVAAPPQRVALGVLFLFLAAAFGGVAYAAARAATDEAALWVVALAAAALALWLATLSWRAFR